jgi:hypothetical protein
MIFFEVDPSVLVVPLSVAEPFLQALWRCVFALTRAFFSAAEVIPLTIPESRGVSLALLVLAGLLVLVEMIRHRSPMELVILGGFFLPVALLGSQLSSAFFDARR